MIRNVAVIEVMKTDAIVLSKFDALFTIYKTMQVSGNYVAS